MSNASDGIDEVVEISVPLGTYIGTPHVTNRVNINLTHEMSMSYRAMFDGLVRTKAVFGPRDTPVETPPDVIRYLLWQGCQNR